MFVVVAKFEFCTAVVFTREATVISSGVVLVKMVIVASVLLCR